MPCSVPPQPEQMCRSGWSSKEQLEGCCQLMQSGAPLDVWIRLLMRDAKAERPFHSLYLLHLDTSESGCRPRQMVQMTGALVPVPLRKDRLPLSRL